MTVERSDASREPSGLSFRDLSSDPILVQGTALKSVPEIVQGDSAACSTLSA